MSGPRAIEKHPVDVTRIRRIRDGFSWIDRRFVREGWIGELDRDEILLYLFLVCVADRLGLSYYSDPRISGTIKVPLEALPALRARLIDAGLLAYRAPIYQVLDLPESGPEGGPPRPARGPGGR